MTQQELRRGNEIMEAIDLWKRSLRCYVPKDKYNIILKIVNEQIDALEKEFKEL